jgi:hypothetical protein
MLLKIYLITSLERFKDSVNTGSWLKSELPSYLFVLLPASHYLQKCLVDVVVWYRVIYGIFLESFLNSLILCVNVSESSDTTVLLPRLVGKSLIRNWKRSFWGRLRWHLFNLKLSVLIVKPLIIMHNGSLDHLNTHHNYRLSFLHRP